MSAEIPKTTPEKREILDDNARKFTVEPISAQFLDEHSATSFTLTVDWLETSEANEKKVAYKNLITAIFKFY
ncbi:MAG TPA: hypothetical protein VLG36_01985 [Candidatus Chromulinivoraceae bacterium]|nr:hypothetical protein [Candidatus Chromulinivoraceae bacterium]